MPIYTVTCPECHKGLRSSKQVPAGKLVTCPKCGVMFAAPTPKVDGVEVIDDVEVVEDVEVVDDDTPRRKPKRARIVEVVDEEDDRPRRRPKRKSSGGKGPVIAIAAAVCVLLLAGAGGLAYWLLAGGSEEPLAYIPPDCQFVAGGNLQTLWDSPLGTQFEKLLDTGAGPPGLATYKRDTGLSNRELAHSFVASFRAGAQSGTVVLKNGAGYDAAKLSTAMGGDAKTVTVSGKSVYPAGPRGKLYHPTKKVVVMGDDEAISGVLRSGASQSVLAGDMAKLAEKAKGSALWAVISKDALQNQSAMSGILAGMPGGADAMQVLQSASAIGLWAKLDGTDVEFTSAVALTDPSTAQAIADKAKQAPKANPAMMALLPAAFKTLVQELTDSAQHRADGSLALTTMRVKMSTLEAVAGAAAGMIPQAPPPQPEPGGRGGRGRGPGG